MRHRATKRFWQSYDRLPKEVQQSADRAYAVLRENPAHPALRFKKAGEFWSARVGIGHRALAIDDSEGYIWVWIGTHAEYEGMLRKRT